jgi:predicted transcriptional regulator
MDCNELEMNRRSRLEIYLAILETVAEGVGKPTRIMYRANLSWARMQEYIQSLINQGLLVEKGTGKKRYELTEKGFRVLNYFGKIKLELSLESP